MVWGWAGSARELRSTEPSIIEALLGEQHQENYRQPPAASQQLAWSHEIGCLSRSLGAVADADDWGVVLEYELPFEGGRRPDAIVLARDAVLALEFKDAALPTPAHRDQTRAYARDLAEYHSASRSHAVRPILALPSAFGMQQALNGGRLSSCDLLPTALRDLAGSGPQLQLGQWLRGSYEPLPTLIEAARRVFRDEALPHIRRAESAGVPRLLAWLHDLVARASASGERHLVLVTGVPGSGKTLVGLQFVHESGTEGRPTALFLSGNDPLVDVLQDALANKVFVRRMHDFILEYGVRGKVLPPNHVVVFDEAQRAWDVERMQEKKGHPRSEPEVLLQLAAAMPGWGVVIGLVGEGQEIYLGEEAGLAQWHDAVRKAGVPFTTHLPAHLQGTFESVPTAVNDALNLTLSLRTHRADRTQEWLGALIAGRPAEAGRLAALLESSGYAMWVTMDLAAAQRYVHGRYEEEPTKRFGLLASSKARNLRALGIDNEFNATRRLKIGPWFNAPPSDTRSSCQLQEPVTEFQCQGLELDMPIVCWGDDLGWENGWKAYRQTRAAHDSDQLRLNSYRVLMSRGRDGLVIYLPPTLREGQQGALFELLLEAGFSRLP